MSDPGESEDEVFATISTGLNRVKLPPPEPVPTVKFQGPPKLEHHEPAPVPPVFTVPPSSGFANDWDLEKPSPSSLYDPPSKSGPKSNSGRDPSSSSQGEPRKRSRIGLYLLGTYALLATAAAIYGLFFRNPTVINPGHPLSTIPDNFGEFDPAQRKKLTRAASELDGELPKELKVELGQKLQIGQLEVEPIRVEARKLKLWRTDNKQKERVEGFNEPALVLHLRIKNTSNDLAFCPTDPAFNRKAQDGKPLPGTGLVLPGVTVWGGPTEWPLRHEKITRIYEEGQENDPKPLAPNETREYVICTPSVPGLAEEAVSAKEPLLWRVQLRRGLITLNGRDVPVTAVLGIDFKPAQVQTGPG